MTRRLALAALLGLLAFPGAVAAAPTVVGGSAAQVQSAPWTVSLRQAAQGGGSLLCTGAIVDPLHVVTAAHCVFDLNGGVADPASLTVRAGTSNYAAASPGDAEQDRGVSSFRVHPGYVWSTGATVDDVAILALSAPLDLSGPAVQAAPLPAGGPDYPRAGAVTVAGFGRESAGTGSNGSLNQLAGTVDPQGRCGSFANDVVPSADAVAFCASSPTAAVCSGDSGSALVTADAPHTIVGIVSAGPASCAPGSHGVFTNVEAPEILDFLHGDDHPVQAPRETDATYVQLIGSPPLRTGSTVVCRSGNWDGDAAITYAFVDTRTGEVLQQGASGRLVLGARDAGDTIACEAIATNAGGAAMLTTTSTQAVGTAPPLEIEHVPPVTAERGRSVRVGVWVDAGDGVAGTYAVCVAPVRSVAPRACASARESSGGGRVRLTVALRVSRTAPLGTSKLAIAAVAGASHGSATALVRVRR